MSKDRDNGRFSVRYSMNSTPRDSGSAAGASTMIFACGSFGAVRATLMRHSPKRAP